jgi:hypothetical protein
LDLTTAGFTRVKPKMTGRPSYPPKDLLKLYIYGYLNRVRLSRRLEAGGADVAGPRLSSHRRPCESRRRRNSLGRRDRAVRPSQLRARLCPRGQTMSSHNRRRASQLVDDKEHLAEWVLGKAAQEAEEHDGIQRAFVTSARLAHNLRCVLNLVGFTELMAGLAA